MRLEALRGMQMHADMPRHAQIYAVAKNAPSPGNQSVNRTWCCAPLAVSRCQS